jgi:hypothetical protein
VACRLAAILAADIVGYSRLMSEDETGTLEAVKAHRRDIFDPEVARHGGRIVKLMGDGALVEFPSVVEAVQCATAVQDKLAAAADPRIMLRIGVESVLQTHSAPLDRLALRFCRQLRRWFQVPARMASGNRKSRSLAHRAG